MQETWIWIQFSNSESQQKFYGESKCIEGGLKNGKVLHAKNGVVAMQSLTVRGFTLGNCEELRWQTLNENAREKWHSS